ncbi:hypothetical protein FVB32_15660 [Flagellimonas hymeniacidonis]|uniref:PrcB C-terminal domain-containing protein n=1 Tax=Flagellimonas hymeniacidonis TaxID=2603628 RepID=A0A5C8V4P7_9FLAO|nr:hypothetical protein [Flagellimonas hymeniacidonis]TXN35995.1 hypothetical protein FVB32_15660 [Flagellimonas hymeniacidonis]
MKHVIIILLACLTSCKAQKEGQSEAEQQDENMILIDHDGYSGIDAFEASIIQDEKSLRSFYGKINQTRKPGLPVPSINFSENSLLIVCLGPQNSTVSPIVRKESESDGEMVISIALSDTTKSENQIISYPFYIYKIPQTSKKVDFRKKDW